ncbi:hypothetical protein Pint_30009 [Pistacia integerrima]|uniref:Uncharacterized protein n=1 Tax=Pistacia integerrima TaxID=434235 RepID=A0ACC0X0L1_9ROSI|nr:hypothetical protein Pint_30009 [Pistacia integerrima]
MAEAIVTPITVLVWEVGKLLVAPIGSPFMVVYAERNLEKINQGVIDWLADVNSVILETEKLIQKQENDTRRFQPVVLQLDNPLQGRQESI